MLQTETSAIFNTWWLKATVQEPGENNAVSAIGGDWETCGHVGFAGVRILSVEVNINLFHNSLGLFGYLLDYILEDKGYQVLELEATSVLGDTLAPSHVYIYINIYIYVHISII
jgi:hypothetical protein